MNALAWVFSGVVALGLILHLLARLVEIPFAAKILGAVPWLPSAWFGPRAEGQPVSFDTADGVRLQGVYLPASAPRRRGAIVLAHEFNADRWSTFPYARALRRRGFDVLLFDFRNHGESGRSEGYEPTPWVSQYELIDLRAAIDCLCAHSDESRLGVFGVGRGGTAAFCLAADEPRIRAVAVDGVVPTEAMQLYSTRQLLRRGSLANGLGRLAPAALLRGLGVVAKRLLGWRCGCRLVDVEQTALCVRAPALLIHGRHDPYLPLDVAETFRSRLQCSARLWIAPQAEHKRAISSATAEYQRRLVRFFARHLADRRSKGRRGAQVRPATAPQRPQPQPAVMAGTLARVVAVPLTLIGTLGPLLRSLASRSPW